jgi:filamentous hemagglutinin family protein
MAELGLGPTLISAGQPTIPGFYGKVANRPAAPAANALPRVRNIVQGVSSLEKPADNKLVVHQNQDKAIVDWNSFDIGANAWTHFDQQGHADWAALNRIHDRNPSQIYGRLSADGKVFLVNQNGILFSRGAQVNVGGMAASALNIANQDFVEERLRFQMEDYTGSGRRDATVANHGTIQTQDGGEVFLIGPKVENGGTIESPLGQIGLAAGEQVTLEANGLAKSVNVQAAPGTATNHAEGRMLTDQGTSGMYGAVVNQNGLIRSVTAVRRNGRIELFASDKITTGAGSRTECPVTESAEEVHESLEEQMNAASIRLAGLDPDYPANPQVGAGVIEHRGTISAPSGSVSLHAEERVYLADGSRISVAGEWVDASAEDTVAEAQLNSVELRDEYGQKSGLLKGEKIRFDKRTGSTIGHVSGALTNDQRSARALNTEGGTIDIKATRGDIVVRDQAALDFSGGGFNYAAGSVETSRLAAGGRVYSLAEAPDWLRYDALLGYQEKVHRKFGQVQAYNGLYFGGASPVRDYVPAHSEGSHAGTLTLSARQIHLAGQLAGGARAGIFQDLTAELEDEQGLTITRGRAAPQGGTIALGNQTGLQYNMYDWSLEDVVLQASTPELEANFGLNTPLDGAGGDESAYRTVLGADVLNASGAGTIQIKTNFTFSTSADAALELPAGGAFNVTARRIEHQGAIRVPAGEITLITDENTTAFETIEGIPGANPKFKLPGLTERIVLSQGSVLDVSGEQADYSGLPLGQGATRGLVRKTGGTIDLLDKNDFGQGVFVNQGARLDFRGGYLIGADGSVKGGAAGKLNVAGDAVVLAGDLDSHALAGQRGGDLTLHATQVAIAAAGGGAAGTTTLDGDIAAHLRHRLTLDPRALAGTGIAGLTLRSENDLIVAAGTQLGISAEKELPPTPQGAGQGALNNWIAATGSVASNASRPGYALVAGHELGATRIALEAGKIRDDSRQTPMAQNARPENREARVIVQAGARLAGATGGTISAEGPGVTIAGELSAPAGTIDLTAKYLDVVLADGGRLSVPGVQRPEAGPVVAGIPRVDHTPLAGGVIHLTAENGAIDLRAGSRIDLSGPQALQRWLPQADGTVRPVMAAAAAGRLNVVFSTDLNVAGQIDAQAQLGLDGGTLSLMKSNPTDALTLDGATVGRFTAAGFDDLAFSALRAICLPETLHIAAGRHLTLDAPELQLGPSAAVTVDAPWVTLANTAGKYEGDAARSSYGLVPQSAGTGDGTLAVTSQWTDLEGSFVISGATEVDLRADRLVRLGDELYNNRWEGRLLTAADLSITSAMITPATDADFTFRTSGTFATRHSGRPVPPGFTAGGSVAVEAASIDHNGVIAAPLGTIRLAADEGRILLGRESQLSTVAGEDVQFGSLNETYWYRTDKADTANAEGIAVEEALRGVVQIDGREVIALEGSRIDVSGSDHAIFGATFLAGIDGSENPLAQAGTYVVVPGQRVDLPGEAIYLSGNGAADGLYTILPAEYAFLEGAMVLTEVSASAMPGAYAISAQGGRLVYGTATHAGSSADLTATTAYTLRSAKEVLKQGYFQTARLSTGGGGGVAIDGDTAVLRGAIYGSSLEGYTGGRLALNAGEITIGGQASQLPTHVDMGTSLAALGIAEGHMLLEAAGMSDTGFDTVQIGAAGVTQSVVLEAGAHLSADQVVLAADGQILLQRGSVLEAAGDIGEVRLLTPGGQVRIADQARVHAANGVVLSTSDMQMDGTLSADNSRLTLAGDDLYVVADDQPHTAPGIYLTPGLWDNFQGFDQITLSGQNGVHFLGGASLAVSDTLTIDTPGLTAQDLTAQDQVVLTAATVRLNNTHAPSQALLEGGDGRLQVTAEQVVLGPGDLKVNGFAEVRLDSRGTLIMQGRGSLQAAAALAVTAPGLALQAYVQRTAQADGTIELTYQAADYHLDTRGYALTLGGSAADGTAGEMGNLRLTADRIAVGTDVDAAGGRLVLEALGTATTDGIAVIAGGRLRSTGREGGAAGGELLLSAAGGDIDIQEGALLDVSGNGAGNAGSLTLEAAHGRVLTAGGIAGRSRGGQGGRLGIVTLAGQDASSQIAAATAGGFDHRFDLAVRQGDLTIAEGDTLTAANIHLSADQGNLTMAGTLAADGPTGGRVSLAAGGDLDVVGGIRAGAASAGATGGSVWLGAQGNLRMGAEAAIDVSGGAGGRGGRVHLRAPRAGNSIAMALAGRVDGADQVVVEAARVYDNVSSLNAAFFAQMAGDAQTFMSDLAWQSGLQGVAPERLSVRPGIEIRSAADGDLATSGSLDLTGLRFAGAPGILTLRSAGSLTIGGAIGDQPTAIAAMVPGYTGPDTWGINLVAGADLASADPLRVNNAQGHLNVGANSVYSENGTLALAVGGNLAIGSRPVASQTINDFMNANLATFSGAIEGRVAGDLTLTGGVIQSATGDIRLEVGGNLTLAADGQGDRGAIRTTGRYAPSDTRRQQIMDAAIAAGLFPEGSQDWAALWEIWGTSDYWDYGRGGDVRLAVGGAVSSPVVGRTAWDDQYQDILADPENPAQLNHWSASYGSGSVAPTQGLATMAGGDLAVVCGGDFLSQAGTFGQGDLTIRAGGDLDGRFLVHQGDGLLQSQGNVGGRVSDMAIELAAARVTVQAQGHITLGTVSNPTMKRRFAQYNLTYSPDAAITLEAAHGDVTLTGVFGPELSGDNPKYLRLLPPSLTIRAGRDIRFANDFVMAPSASGNLVLAAGNDILGRAQGEASQIIMSDLDEATAYGWRPNDTSTVFGNAHGAMPVHQADTEKSTISAGRDLRDMKFVLPEAAEISAGRDIRDILYDGQNLHADDVTTITAGRDIVFATRTLANTLGILHGGPGSLVVQAGNTIDLGTSMGIQGMGNTRNPALPQSSGPVYVVAGYGSTLPQSSGSIDVGAGYGSTLATQAMQVFFQRLRTFGTRYSELLAEGEVDAAQAEVDKAREEVIEPLLAEQPEGEGTINMINSQISSAGQSGDLSVIAGGDINVGRSTLTTEGQKNSGIFTERGGDVALFAKADININESRVMTFWGGDITMWSDAGSINAGRGSKTAISTPEVSYVDDPTDPEGKRKFQVLKPPAVGSGIRTLTYDSDGPEGPDEEPLAGDVYLFAPEGEIDAGEAGIAGTNVFLGAVSVVNAQNIDIGGASVGVPDTSAAAGSLGALAGAGSLGDSSAMNDAASVTGSAQDRFSKYVSELSQDLVPKWIAVEVVGFDETQPGKSEQDEDESRQ